MRRLQREQWLSRPEEPHSDTRSNSPDPFLVQDNVRLILKAVKAIREKETAPDYSGRPHSPAWTRTSTATAPESSRCVYRHASLGSVSTFSAPEQNGTVDGSSPNHHASDSLGSFVAESTAPSQSSTGTNNSSADFSLVSPSRKSGRHSRPGGDSWRGNSCESDPLGQTSVVESRALCRQPPLSKTRSPPVPLPAPTQGPEVNSEGRSLDVRPPEEVLKMVTSQSFNRIWGLLERRDES